MAERAHITIISVDPKTQRQLRLAQIEEITLEIAQIKAGAPDADRLAALERDLDILQTIEKFS